MVLLNTHNICFGLKNKKKFNHATIFLLVELRDFFQIYGWGSSKKKSSDQLTGLFFFF